MSALIRRNAQGQYAIGQSGNPGGRTSALTEVRALMKPNAARYVEALHRLLDDPDPSIRLAAVREAFDRLLGKPTASIEQDVRHLDINQAIQQMWLEAVKMKPAAAIEGEVTTTALPSHNSNDATDHDAVAHEEW
jgi:hypothetical protein